MRKPHKKKKNTKARIIKPISFFCVILGFIVNTELLIIFKQFLMFKFENKVIKYFLAYLLVYEV